LKVESGAKRQPVPTFIGSPTQSGLKVEQQRSPELASG